MKNMFLRFACILLLASVFPAVQAQDNKAQPIIDNGFLSYQGWAGAIHPSGDFVVRADRSVIHAYDRRNHRLFQTYQSPCIATDIYFSANGQYMIVSTFGEIGDACNKTLVYNFYTGEILFNEKGRHIVNYGPDDLFHFIQGHEENPELPDMVDVMLNIYDMAHMEKPQEQIPLMPIQVYDTLTTVLNPMTGDEASVFGKYTLEDIKAGKIDSIEGYKATIEQMVKEAEKDLAIFYKAEMYTQDPVFNPQDFMVMAHGMVFVAEDNGFGVYRVRTQEKVATIDSAKIFGCNYMPREKKMVFKGIAESWKMRSFDLTTLKTTNVNIEPFYPDHTLFESDSMVYTVDIRGSGITIKKYHLRDLDTYLEYKNLETGLPEWEMFTQGQYYAQVLPSQRLVLHNRFLLIDLNDFSFHPYLTAYDTTLVHPAVVQFHPSQPQQIGINNWDWNFTQARQFEKQGKDSYRIGTRFAGENNLKQIKNAGTGLKNYVLNAHYVFNHPVISNPFMVYKDIFGDPISNTSIAHPERLTLLDQANLYVYRDSLLALEYDTLLMLSHKITEKELARYEDQFKNFAAKNYSVDRLYELNHQFPEFVHAQSYSNEFFDYKKPCTLTRENRNKWFYDPICQGGTGRTRDKKEMEKNFAGSILKPSLLFKPGGQPVYCVNVLNMEQVPNLTYAGIIPENDICFQDIVFPIHQHQLMLNYAHGIFQLRDESGKVITQSSLYDNGDFIHVTPDGYYFASKNRLNRVSIRLGKKVYPIEQFDMKYNRPDIVLARLGCKDAATVDSYRKAYLKRLKKMGFTEDMLKDDFHLPEIEIQNLKQLPGETDSSSIELNLQMNDSRYELDRVNIWINDVPVFGTDGINLREAHALKLDRKIKLDLCEGKNKITVSVLNQAGAESYKTGSVVNVKNKTGKPNLYLVTIGDSKYQDTRYNLSFAAKDARDISNTFNQNTSALYGSVYTYTVTDEEVTRERIAGLKKELQKARRDDVVLVTVAGHGVLDKNYNYYLATYQMDFSAPEKNGLPYEELENLLDGIAPLKKTLLIDACHSGEVDKEEVESLVAQNTSTDNGIKFRTAGAGIQKKGLGLKTTGELMGELFTDLRKGTGTTVISSASGVEYAMESDEWQNGLFTYCLLHGLKNLAADTNQDGEVWLSELQQYLRTEVARLSKGKQQPTSRMENLSMDFRLW